MDEKDESPKMNRRDFLKALGGASALTLAACGGKDSTEAVAAEKDVPRDKMTYRTNPSTGDKVSLLGYGCMRLPTLNGEPGGEIDQETVNRLTGYALGHGVNYFDTSPAYRKR